MRCTSCRWPCCGESTCTSTSKLQTATPSVNRLRAPLRMGVGGGARRRCGALCHLPCQLPVMTVPPPSHALVPISESSHGDQRGAKPPSGAVALGARPFRSRSLTSDALTCPSGWSACMPLHLTRRAVPSAHCPPAATATRRRRRPHSAPGCTSGGTVCRSSPAASWQHAWAPLPSAASSEASAPCAWRRNPSCTANFGASSRQPCGTAARCTCC